MKQLAKEELLKMIQKVVATELDNREQMAKDRLKAEVLDVLAAVVSEDATASNHPHYGGVRDCERVERSSCNLDQKQGTDQKSYATQIQHLDRLKSRREALQKQIHDAEHALPSSVRNRELQIDQMYRKIDRIAELLRKKDTMSLFRAERSLESFRHSIEFHVRNA